MDKSKTCFFTGHRKIAQSKIEIVKAQLAENIEKMIAEYGVTQLFMNGGLPLGFGLQYAQNCKKCVKNIRI